LSLGWQCCWRIEGSYSGQLGRDVLQDAGQASVRIFEALMALRRDQSQSANVS
jgi:hypothetical protein